MHEPRGENDTLRERLEQALSGHYRIGLAILAIQVKTRRERMS